MIALSQCAQSIDYVTLVTNRSQKDDIIDLLMSSGCHLIDVVYAKGSVKSGYFKDMLGLVPEEKKVLITCIIASNRTDHLFEGLITEFHFNEPNTGVAFVVPVDKLSV